MKAALMGSWILFAGLFGWQAGAADYIMKNGYGIFDTFKVAATDNKMLKWDVHLDDAEIDRIRDACKER